MAEVNYLLYKLTRPEIEKYLEKNEIVIFPVGSTEQHGKHMAIDNDAYSAFEIAKRVAEKTGVLIAPTMPIGYSIHHMNFKGTITLNFQTMVNVYKDVCESLIRHGFKKIVIFNAHGGNINPIAAALREIRKDTGIKVYSVMVHPMENGWGSSALKILKQEGGGHACEMETSFALYLGQRILMDKAEKWKPPKDQPKLEQIYRRKIAMASNFDERTEIGSLGDPTIASTEKGKKLVESVVSELVEFIKELKNM